jgi:hypothetical protein
MTDILDPTEVLNWLIPALKAIGITEDKVRVENEDGTAPEIVVDNYVHINQDEDTDGTMVWSASFEHCSPSSHYEEPDSYDDIELHSERLNPMQIAQAVARHLAEQAIENALENVAYDKEYGSKK